MTSSAVKERGDHAYRLRKAAADSRLIASALIADALDATDRLDLADALDQAADLLEPSTARAEEGS